MRAWQRWFVVGTVATIASALTTSDAAADATDDCLHLRSPQLRIKACNEAIATVTPASDRLAAAYRSRGAAHASLGQQDQALADYADALRLNPQFSQALEERGQLRLARSEWDLAQADYTAALKINPKLQSALIGRGFAEFSKGALDAAIADYTEAIAYDSRLAVAFNNRGLAYRHKDNLQQAIADYTAALQINPLYARAYTNRGYAFEALKQPSNAIADFRRALAIDPSSTGASEGLLRLGADTPKPNDTAGALAAGAALVQKNCSWCHAIGTSGDSPNARAPRFRDLHLRYPIASLAQPLSRDAVAPHSEMPRFELTDQEVESVIAYLNSLAPKQQ